VLSLFAQELPTSCVAACVRMILHSYGFQLNELTIRLRCGHTNLGMRLNQLANGLAELPFNIEYHTDWNIYDIKETLQRGVFVIAAIDLRFIDGINAFHAVVIAEVQSDLIVAHDPLPPPARREISWQTFVRAWESADQQCVMFEPDVVKFMVRLKRPPEVQFNTPINADDLIIIEGELNHLNAEAFLRSVELLNIEQDSEIVIDMFGFDVEDGVSVATAVNALRDLLKHVSRLQLIGAPQIFCHNLYRVGLLGPNSVIELIDMREDEPYG
jgi:hypothetical protein